MVSKTVDEKIGLQRWCSSQGFNRGGAGGGPGGAGSRAHEN